MVKVLHEYSYRWTFSRRAVAVKMTSLRADLNFEPALKWRYFPNIYGQTHT